MRGARRAWMANARFRPSGLVVGAMVPAARLDSGRMGPGRLGPLSSQTKCNTTLRCCNGRNLCPTRSRRPVRHCHASRSRTLDPPNRSSSGSRAIDSLSRAEAQFRLQDRLQTSLRATANQRSALGPVQDWSGIPTSEPKSSAASNEAGHPNRSPAACVSKAPQQPSVMKPSTDSSMPRSAEPTTMTGGTIFHEPNSSADIAAKREAAPSNISKTVSPSATGRSILMPVASRDTGKPTTCCSVDTGSPCSSLRNDHPASFSSTCR